MNFSLDASNVLTVEALDLESGRQHVRYTSEGTKPAGQIADAWQRMHLINSFEQGSICQAVAVALD